MSKKYHTDPLKSHKGLFTRKTAFLTKHQVLQGHSHSDTIAQLPEFFEVATNQKHG